MATKIDKLEKTEKTEPKSDHRQRDLDTAVQLIHKQFGDGSIMRLGDDHARLKIDVIPTGAISVDMALGVGGFPRGRVIEIYGPESSGKTTLVLTAIAQAQKAGGLAAFVDVEHALRSEEHTSELQS